MANADAGIDRVLWTEAEVAARVRELAAELAADLRALPEPPVIVGVATGALLFLADLIRRVDAPLAVDFVRVESYGAGTESCGAPRITSDLKVDVAGKHVVVVSTPLSPSLSDPRVCGLQCRYVSTLRKQRVVFFRIASGVVLRSAS
jgi:hypoxanthine-guanine phosphoribosyltransferase